MDQEQSRQRGQITNRVFTRDRFQTFDTSGGRRLQRLAKSLGVITEQAANVAGEEAKDAFEAGVAQRIKGVERDEAKHDSLLGGFFTKQTRDGFDYQDALIELPELQMKEQIAMSEALRESRNPEDFARWIEGQDERIAGVLEGTSDVFNFTIAKGMTKHREKLANRFATMVQSNRESDRRKAQAAAKRSAKLARKNQLEAMSVALANDLTQSPEQAGAMFKDLVDDFVAAEGGNVAEGKKELVDEFIDTAFVNQNEALLDQIPTKVLSGDLREKIAKARISIQRETVRQENAEYQREQRAIATEKRNGENAAREAARASVVDGLASPADITNNVLQSSEWASKNPEFAQKIGDAWGGVYDDNVSISEEAAILSRAEELAEQGAITGDYTQFDELVASVEATPGAVRSSKLPEMAEYKTEAEGLNRPVVKAELNRIAKEVRDEFLLKNPSKNDPVSLFAGGVNGGQYTLAQQNAIIQQTKNAFKSLYRDHITNMPDQPIDYFQMADKAKQLGVDEYLADNPSLVPSEPTEEGGVDPDIQESIDYLLSK